MVCIQIRCRCTFDTTCIQTGSYPGSIQPDDVSIYNTDYPMNSNNCSTMVGVGTSATRVGKASSVCCYSNEYEFECVKRFGAPSTLSSVSCSDGYFMSSCSGWSTQNNIKYVGNTYFQMQIVILCLHTVHGTLRVIYALRVAGIVNSSMLLQFGLFT